MPEPVQPTVVAPVTGIPMSPFATPTAIGETTTDTNSNAPVLPPSNGEDSGPVGEPPQQPSIIPED